MLTTTLYHHSRVTFGRVEIKKGSLLGRHQVEVALFLGGGSASLLVSLL